ncbi:MAG: UvrD-helicase domain-containing protein [Gemmatimonadota bacterium]|nr:MAG: UvrD-helicase domain-containing protein [Gemmatimonadota bacterium]
MHAILCSRAIFLEKENYGVKSILDRLNPAQGEAVRQTEGPLLVLAGAGSGKTRVLTHRIAFLIGERGIKPWNILAVTFTNKAAGEMRERVEKLVGFGSREIWLGTFHSVCARILRREAERVGYGTNFAIYDPEDQLKVIAEVMKELNIGERETPAKAVRAHIDGAKNEVIGPDEYGSYAGGYFEEKTSKIYGEYQRRLRENNAFDFGDLIMQTAVLFKKDPEVLGRYQKQFRYILVDEYQDTNHAQYVLINQLASSHRNLCVVGDDDQSIYGWRGADIKNILDFEKDYPEAKIVRLDQNYRSTKTILAAAGAVIAHNRGRKGKELWTENTLGQKIVLMEGYDEREEAQHVADRIQEELVANGRSLKDFVVLYRTNAQSRALEDRLRGSGIPYTIVGGLKFYERKEVKDVLAYLKVLVNPRDTVSLKRIINVPKRGIGEVTVTKLEAFAAEREVILYEVFERLEEIEGISPRLKDMLGSFWQLMKKYRTRKEQESAETVARELIEASGYLEMLAAEGTIDSENRAENVRELLYAISEYMARTQQATLESFLAEVSLVTDIDQWDDRTEVVTLMTLHCAKGLEFPVVFITGLEDGLFPLARVFDNPHELEEERRLFYVGMTRAKEKLYLSLACRRHRYSESLGSLRSRFLEEVPLDFFEESSAEGIEDILYTPEEYHSSNSPSGFQDELSSFPHLEVGQWVIHPSFGRGRILDKDGRGENLKVTILFDHDVRKKIMVKYANLQLS